MIEVTATKLRNNLFEFLAKVSKGGIIVIQRNGENVGEKFAWPLFFFSVSL